MVSWAPGDRRNFDHARTGWPLLAKHAATACEGCHDNRRLVLAVDHRLAGGQSTPHDLPRAASALRQLSLRRAPRSAGTRVPALPHRQRLDLHVRALLRPRRFQLSAARKTQTRPLRRLPSSGSGSKHSRRGLPETARGQLHADEADRARDLRELPPRSAPGEPRPELRRLSHRSRVERHPPHAAPRDQLSRQDPLPLAGPSRRRLLQGLPRSVPVAAGAVSRAFRSSAAATVTPMATRGSSRPVPGWPPPTAATATP